MAPKNIPIHVKPEGGGRHGESHAQERGGPVDAEDEATVEMVERVQVEEESSEDEDPLMIMSKKDFKKKLKATDSQTTKTTDRVEPVGSGRKLNPPTISEPVATKSKSVHVPPTKRAEPAEDDDEDDDEMFNLEAGEGDETLEKAISARGSPKKHLPAPADEEPEDHDKSDEQSNDELDEREAQFKPNAPIQASPPIGVPIGKTTDIPPKVPPMPQGSVPKMSVGSYAGKSISMAPVKNPELLEKIAKFEDVRPFFVGSVNGRSGPDPSNAKSYRASLPSPARGGYSLMERWMREKEEGVKYASDKEDDEKEIENEKE